MKNSDQTKSKEGKLAYRELKKVLRELVKGNHMCMVDVPNYKKVKAEIIGVNFRNILYQPICRTFRNDSNII